MNKYIDCKAETEPLFVNNYVPLEQSWIHRRHVVSRKLTFELYVLFDNTVFSSLSSILINLPVYVLSFIMFSSIFIVHSFL